MRFSCCLLMLLACGTHKPQRTSVARPELADGGLATPVCPPGTLGDGVHCLATTPLAVGDTHACAVYDDGTLRCWGDNQYGKAGGIDRDVISPPAQVDGAKDWASVSAGAARTCGLRKDGTLWCWGNVAARVLNLLQPTWTATPTQVGTERWAFIAVGDDGTCGIRSDGTLWCWGQNLFAKLTDSGVGEALPPDQVPDATWQSVIVSNWGVRCGLQTDDTLWCWGDTYQDTSPSPAQLCPGDHWKQIASRWSMVPYPIGQGYDSSGGVQAIREDGSLQGFWGYSPGSCRSETATRFHNFVSYAAGDGNWCGVFADGTLQCWGLPVEGINGTSSTPAASSAPPDGWLSVVLGHRFGCGLQRDHSVWCWGRNDRGQTGQPPVPDRAVPTLVDATSRWTDVSAYHGGCAIKADQTLWCWGTNWDWENTSGPQNQRPVSLGGAWQSIQLTSEHACGLHPDGSLSCWTGDNQSGLVTPTGTNFVAATIGTEGVGLSGFYAEGIAFICGLTADGRLSCVGSDSLGEVGVGPPPFNPYGGDYGLTAGGIIKVGETTSTWTRFSAAADAHICAVQSDGSLWCWGNNYDGQLGAAVTAKSIDHPALAGGTAQWIAVAAGQAFTCAIQADHSLWCWGKNQGGVLGQDPQTLTASAQPLKLLDDVVDVWAGISHACALKADHSLWCWGDNAEGELGNEQLPLGMSLQPVQVSGPADWVKASAGDRRTCGIRLDGSLWCWGSNQWGGLGIGGAWADVPTAVPR